MTGYNEFLRCKVVDDPATGLTDIPELPDSLFDFQDDITRWALRRGRAAIFAGIGSEGFVALQENRRFLGMELKASYYRQAVENMKAAIRERRDLFSEVETA